MTSGEKYVGLGLGGQSAIMKALKSVHILDQVIGETVAQCDLVSLGASVMQVGYC